MEKMIPVVSKVHCILPLGCSERLNRQKKTLHPLQYRTTYAYLKASISSRFTKIEHLSSKINSSKNHGLLSNNIKGFQLICLQLPFWKMQVTSMLYISPRFSHTWKKHKKASPTQAQKNKCIPTVFNHTKLCIYYAIRKSFTDSWLTVLPKQDIVTNCKGIAMRHLARQWKLNTWHFRWPYVMLRCARKVVHTMS